MLQIRWLFRFIVRIDVIENAASRARFFGGLNLPEHLTLVYRLALRRILVDPFFYSHPFHLNKLHSVFVIRETLPKCV